MKNFQIGVFMKMFAFAFGDLLRRALEDQRQKFLETRPVGLEPTTSGFGNQRSTD